MERYEIMSILEVGRNDLCSYVLQPQIYTRDCGPPILPCVVCNGIVSHGAQFGVFWYLPTTLVFADHTQKQMQIKCVHDLCAPCGVLRLFVFTLKTAVHVGNTCTLGITIILIT